MTRQEFLKQSAALGLGSMFFSTLFASCEKEDIFFRHVDVEFSGKVLIVGAGAAGLMAGYILEKQKIDVEILEASAVFGGRIKRADDFADFPIDLGGEWIHTKPSILPDLVNNPEASVDVETILYNPQTISIWKNNELKKRNIVKRFYAEHKFKNTTWYGFFEKYIVPPIADKIRYNSPVTQINHSGEKVLVQNAQGEQFEADKILVTVPLTMLKNGSIEFVPALPKEKTDALSQVDMPAGLKVFIEFSERFYPDILFFGGLKDYVNGENGNKIFYDAAFRKDSDRHILGLFTVGKHASEYVELGSDEAIFKRVMEELDEVFDGKATKHYQKHIVQNWSTEPYIQGSYADYDDYSAMDMIGKPIGGKVYFAGEALAENTSTVHGAAESSYVALKDMLGIKTS